LGSGTYAIVKEAVHIKTGKYYACKVINKKLMEGREYMVRAPRRLADASRSLRSLGLGPK
jgi:calcium/calmodulin-dependent protein kinase I